MNNRREKLPRATDRIRLGSTSLFVSPLCIGMTRESQTIEAAFEAGVNFFFISSDLHWPLYEATRRGISELLCSGKARREDLVIGVCSYLEHPLFAAMQFNEVIDSTPGLKSVDLAIAGMITSQQSYDSRLPPLRSGKSRHHFGLQAIGASFHTRSCALAAHQANDLDVAFIRYNTGHPGAQSDLFPMIREGRQTLNYCFKSTMFKVTKDAMEGAGLHALPVPDICDYYRFAISRSEIDGLLCSPKTPWEVKSLVRALERSPLDPDEDEYLIMLSKFVHRLT